MLRGFLPQRFASAGRLHGHIPSSTALTVYEPDANLPAIVPEIYGTEHDRVEAEYFEVMQETRSLGC